MTSIDEYVITSDKLRFDVAAIHAYLIQSYWSPGIPRATVERANIRNARSWRDENVWIEISPVAGNPRD